MTPSKLKALHLEHNPDSHFFDRANMRFAGDTMANYTVYSSGNYWVLARKKAVKHGLKASAYFDKETLKTCSPNQTAYSR